MPRSLQTGRVWAIVSTVSSIEAPRLIIVEIIFDVSVERMFALTPLPRPSERTSSVLSGVFITSTRSPQSSSFFLIRLL